MATSEELRKKLHWLNKFRRINIFRSPFYSSAMALASDAINALAEKEKELADLKKQCINKN